MSKDQNTSNGTPRKGGPDSNESTGANVEGNFNSSQSALQMMVDATDFWTAETIVDAESAPEPDDEVESLGYSYPAPYTSWENFGDYRLFPFRAIGKQYF